VAEQSLEQRFLKELLPMLDHEASGVNDLTLGGKVCSTTQRRPDAIWIGPQHAVLLEVDEDWHNSYDPSCEAVRMQELHTSLQAIKGLEYKTACLRVGISRLVEFKRDLVESCARILNKWCKTAPNFHAHAMAIFFLNYPRENKNRAYIENAAASLVSI
jgi:hypothetical protein